MPVYVVLWRASKAHASHVAVFRTPQRAEAIARLRNGVMLELKGGIRNAFQVVLAFTALAQTDSSRWPSAWGHPS